MPYATNPDDGVRIYYEVEGTGPPLVLVHGGSTNLNWWKRDGYIAWQHLDSYVDSLRGDYQLILIDPRGHGKSDKPRDPEAYSKQTIAMDIVCVLDDLSITAAHYAGYSSGAITAWALAAYSPDRLRSLIAVSGHPFSLPEYLRESRLGDIERFQNDGMDWWVEMIEKDFGQMTASARSDMAANDPLALAAAQVMNVAKPDLTPQLQDLSIPVLILGSNLGDQYRQFARTLPDATVVLLEGLNHAEEISRSDILLPHITAFLERVETE